MIEPRTLKGFRDYLPEAMIPRERLIAAAQRVYRSFGYSPIDTPALDFDAIARKEQRAARPKVLTLSVAVLLAVAWLTPFYYLVVSVFKSNTEYGTGNPLALPQSWEPALVNVYEAWTKTRMADGMLNSALYGLVGAGAAMFIAALAAYGLTRIDFLPGDQAGFWERNGYHMRGDPWAEERYSDA